MAAYLPTGDAELLGFGQNYSAVVTAGPVALGLDATIAAELASRVAAFQDALEALESPANKNPVRYYQKSQTKADLVEYIRTTARQIQGTMSVTDAQRVQLRLTVRDTTPSQAEVIDVMPAVTVVQVQGHNFRLRVRDASGEIRGRIPQADGAVIYSFVGATPPAGPEGWNSEGPVTKDSVIVAMPASVPVGSRVWFTAQWFNTRGTGPGCTPVCAVVGAEGALAA